MRLRGARARQVGQLRLLVDLNVFNNRLTSIPAEVMALEELLVRARSAHAAPAHAPCARTMRTRAGALTGAHARSRARADMRARGRAVQDVNLAGNKLSELPPVGPAGFRKVEKLSLFWNRLSAVPPLTGTRARACMHACVCG
jgi:hypothetical protein